MRITSGDTTTDPFRAVAVIVVAKAAGAACTEYVAITAAKVVAVEVTPRFRKTCRSFSKARATRF
jgi:hypothetical protein